MTTSGYFIFKYKGKYYVFHNRHDSYVQYGLGSRVIENIKKLSKYEIIELLEYFLIILEEQDDSERENNTYEREHHVDFVSIEHALTNPYAYEHFVKTHEPVFVKSGKINIFYESTSEYLYIINLDQQLFVIKTREMEVQFSLFNIPDDWYDFYQRVLETKYESENEYDEDYKKLW